MLLRVLVAIALVVSCLRVAVKNSVVGLRSFVVLIVYFSTLHPNGIRRQSQRLCARSFEDFQNFIFV